jgi:hypothetical protein
MEGFMTDSRNIIIVKKGEKNIIKKDQYASPQNVFIFQGNTGDDILAILKKHPEIIQIIRTEIEECQRINKKGT